MQASNSESLHCGDGQLETFMDGETQETVRHTCDASELVLHCRQSTRYRSHCPRRLLPQVVKRVTITKHGSHCTQTTHKTRHNACPLRSATSDAGSTATRHTEVALMSLCIRPLVTTAHSGCTPASARMVKTDWCNSKLPSITAPWHLLKRWPVRPFSLPNVCLCNACVRGR